jgi:ATP-dependent Clp protease ATP-binding subunit ClpA
MRHDLAIEKVRPPEGADPYTDSSFISEKAGRTSDEVAAMLGIEEEDLLEALDFDEKDLREASRKEAKAKREAAKPGNYDARTLDEAAKDGLSEADLLREELAGERRRRKGLERVNANVLKSIAYNKRIARGCAGRSRHGESLKQLERWLNSNVPAELRGNTRSSSSVWPRRRRARRGGSR